MKTEDRRLKMEDGERPESILHPPSSILALEAAAAAWLGTPFCERSAKKGAGVCCHALPLEIYFDAGWLVRFDYPMGAPGTARVQKADDFAATGAPFVSVPLPSSPSPLRGNQFPDGDVPRRREGGEGLEIMPGDTLQFQLGRTSHFVLVLSDRYIHATKAGVQYAVSLQPNWLPRLARIWRPKLASV